jgi:hypothetical protein
MHKPLNAMIAEELGWTTWQDLRPGRDQWFQERPASEGQIEVRHLTDYMHLLRRALENTDNQ